MAYAAKHPERVTDLMLYGGYARGRRWRGQAEQEHAVVAAILAGWREGDPTFRHLFSMLFLPHGTAERMTRYEDLMVRSTNAETAVRADEPAWEHFVSEMHAFLGTEPPTRQPLSARNSASESVRCSSLSRRG